MNRLLLVSNRLPVNLVKKGTDYQFQPSAGGLTSGLSTIFELYKSIWIGWPGISLEKTNKQEKQMREQLLSCNYLPVFLSQKEIDLYYHGFSNKTIWPLFHYFAQYSVYQKNTWDAYRQVNEAFCESVTSVAEPDDVIWIHDYHLMLLPKLIREKLPNTMIGFFLHIPFPSFEIFCQLPWCREIIHGLLAADLIGFHTYDYVRHFVETVQRLCTSEHTLGYTYVNNHFLGIDAFPMGIDFKRFATAAQSETVQKEIKKMRKKVGDRTIILSIDRLDYTKGIPERLEAFDLFLERNPEYHEKVSLLLVAVPSRTRVEHYMLLKKRLDELISRINGKYGTIGWVPVWYLYQYQAFPSLIALYDIADVALITPLKDGMNLIAKEFIASKAGRKGILILSEMAGSAQELGEALIVNPNNTEEVAEAIRKALEMSREEQVERNRTMQRRLKRYNVTRWAVDFMDRLTHIEKFKKELGARNLSVEIQRELKHDYMSAMRRLFLLDYDGTLVSFERKPEQAKPDHDLLEMLDKLGKNPKNEVVLISGRDKETLEKWFGTPNISLVAEHGVWLKEKANNWEMIEPLRSDWKEEIRPILDLHADRTPGSFVEEKEFSLVWHYRRANPTLALLRARELKDALLHLTSNLNLGVLEGSKVIEIKNTGISKGRASLHWISKGWDFILGIGDDWTDEDLFAVLPESAYSIKVGLNPSRARFNLDSVNEVRSLLQKLVRS